VHLWAAMPALRSARDWPGLVPDGGPFARCAGRLRKSTTETLDGIDATMKITVLIELLAG
jgi:hypothetical protein